MEWRGRRQSTNIEDRRSARGPMRAGGGSAVGGVGLLAVVVIGYFLGVDLTPLLQGGTGAVIEQGQGSAELTEADREAGAFVATVLADTEDIWARLMREQARMDYAPVTLVLYKDVTASPCGSASGATGPFYCPGDRKIYLDTAFFTTMRRELGAGGDFAMAYVVAHEVAHHLQNELGVLGEANEVRARVSEEESNQISVRIELMADCLSGVWARELDDSLGVVERGDFEEALNAARQIGDDTLQRNAGRVPMPHTFTHGTSAQRMRWFQTGLDSGKLGSCDTFAAARL